jgi:hypothetical protein
MSTVETQELDSAVLTRLLADEDFWPAEPNAVEETGLPDSFVEALILKHLLAGGTVSGRNLAFVSSSTWSNTSIVHCAGGGSSSTPDQHRSMITITL